MTGSTDERMAEALEAASHVIIVVSKDYKESANCRMEAKYANQLTKKGKLKTIFLMVQNEYTTASTPEYCDGWLGIMIGDSLWYPLWNENQIESTANEISKVVGYESRLDFNTRLANNNNNNNLKNNLNKNSPHQTNANAQPLASYINNNNNNNGMMSNTYNSTYSNQYVGAPAPVERIDYKAAYKLLKDADESLNAALLKATLIEFGVKAAEDLAELDLEDYRVLAELLKKVPRKRFLTAIKVVL
jgi:hypothetical protein